MLPVRRAVMGVAIDAGGVTTRCRRARRPRPGLAPIRQSHGHQFTVP